MQLESAHPAVYIRPPSARFSEVIAHISTLPTCMKAIEHRHNIRTGKFLFICKYSIRINILAFQAMFPLRKSADQNPLRRVLVPWHVFADEIYEVIEGPKSSVWFSNT